MGKIQYKALTSNTKSPYKAWTVNRKNAILGFDLKKEKLI
jgi:hypothetical protein